MKPEPEPEPEDRLSSLPDELLHHVFSFVDSLHVIEASSLSRRWRRLHASTPTLSFGYAKFCDRFGGAGLENRFARLIASCLALRDRGFPVLELAFDAGEGRVQPEAIEALVSAAAELGVQRLALKSDLVKFRLPTCLYNTRSLKELTLRSQYMKLSNDLGFPALTKLHLELLQFSDAKFNSVDIISRCPNLATLILIDCNIDDKAKRFRITAPKLTKLVVSYPFDLWYIPKDCEFVIHAPRLARFRYRGIKALSCSLATSARSLEEVDVDVFEGKFELFDGGVKLDDKIDKVSGLLRMVDVFKLATTIKLSQPTIKCLSEASGLVDMDDCCDGRLRDILQSTTSLTHRMKR